MRAAVLGQPLGQAAGACAHRAEASCSCGLEAVEEGSLFEEEGEVGR
jgi:hypothetical protein